MGRALGSRIEFVDIYAHDAYLAMVSHMPHLMAAMLTQVSGGDELGGITYEIIRRRISRLYPHSRRIAVHVAGNHLR